VGTAATCFAGIDVSKATLDACLLLPGGRAKGHAFGNDPRGHADLAQQRSAKNREISEFGARSVGDLALPV
jgi:hypothetical protein